MSRKTPTPNYYSFKDTHRMLDRDAIRVIQKLERAGHQAYLVGGGVRDLLLGIEPKDFDIATSATPSQVNRLFRNCRVIGRRFRLAHIVFGEKIIEVATFRRDNDQSFHQIIELKGKTKIKRLIPEHVAPDEGDDFLIRSDNEYGDPHEDAIRRDFTINGLYYDMGNERIIDFVGGVQDLKNRLVYTIGNPEVRFREDPVRILRAIKFSARLNLGIEPSVYDAMIAHKNEILLAPKPRVFEELLRLLRGGAAHRSVYLLWQTGILSLLLPEVASLLDERLATLIWKRLQIIDKLKEVNALPKDDFLILALLYDLVFEELKENKKITKNQFQDVIYDLSVRLTIPRRMREQMAFMFASQSAFRKNKWKSLTKRAFFKPAALFFAVELCAQNQPIPEWAHKTLPKHLKL